MLKLFDLDYGDLSQQKIRHQVQVQQPLPIEHQETVSIRSYHLARSTLLPSHHGTSSVRRICSTPHIPPH